MNDSNYARRFFATFALTTIFVCASAACYAQTEISKTFYVSPQGSDSSTGTAEKVDGDVGPFATLERARDAVREFKRTLNDDARGVVVVRVEQGLYELDEPLKLTSEDSGSESLAIRWETDPDSPALVTVGRYLPKAKKLDDESALARIKPEVRDAIYCVDLKALGIEDLGTPSSGAELFFQGEPTRLARFPNDGFIKIARVETEGTTENVIHGAKGIKEGIFYFDGADPSPWKNEPDLWVDGYWFWDWSNQKQKVVALDVDAKKMTLQDPWHTYGYRDGQWFYVFNALCELDEPGEFYIDRDKGALYFYPYAPARDERDLLLTLNANVLTLDGVRNLTWSGFETFGSRGTCINGSNCQDVLLEKLAISNCGGSGINLSGERCRVSECELWNLGGAGIVLSGGDRATLRPSQNEVVENYVHNYARLQRMYAPGVTVNGVGARVAHNLVENAPHMGMGFGGNDMTIEYNEIANVCLESNDAGAIYTGRNWTMRGNVLRGNYMHDVSGFEGRGCVGMYLDDMFSSASIEGNLFINVTRAAFIGGGRDCRIADNVFIDCKPAIHIDARALGWCRDHADGWIAEAKEKGTISGIKYDQPPYSTRYPELASIFDEGKTPKAPEGNEVTGNICVGGTWDVNKQGQWQGDSVEPAARPYIKFEKNVVVESVDEPGFVDPENGDFRLKEDSALAKEGYKSLTSEKMGLTSERAIKRRDAARSRVRFSKAI